MIAECKHCHESYWRYRRGHPPNGFCSNAHAEMGARPKDKPIPPTPEEMVRMMRNHRIQAHGTDSMLAWHDCQVCEEMESHYADSILFHVHFISSQIAKRRGVVPFVAQEEL